VTEDILAGPDRMGDTVAERIVDAAAVAMELLG